MQTGYVIEVTEQTFQADVLERSFHTPVVVDFWAAWCGPCRVLGPTLERLASEANGEWVLAKVDVDANQGLAAAFGIQGIPAVRAFRDGRQVAEFVGALPEPAVRQWLTQLGPSKGDLLVEQASVAEERGDMAAAAQAYRQALNEEPARLDAKAGLARAELELRTGESDERALHDRLAADPADVDAVTRLADLEFARGQIEAALDRLVALVRVSTGDARDAARLHLLSLLDTLPPDDARALHARRELANALY